MCLKMVSHVRPKDSLKHTHNATAREGELEVDSEREVFLTRGRGCYEGGYNEAISSRAARVTRCAHFTVKKPGKPTNSMSPYLPGF